PVLGASGQAIASSTLERCEHDYKALKRWFGDFDPPGIPFQVVITDLHGEGAYHRNCMHTVLYCDAKTSPVPDLEFTCFLLVAEVAEVLQSALGIGWNCGSSNGEGLSRVLAAALYPGQIRGFATAADWLDSHRPDFVNRNASTDTNSVANGCSVLFL